MHIAFAAVALLLAWGLFIWLSQRGERRQSRFFDLVAGAPRFRWPSTAQKACDIRLDDSRRPGTTPVTTNRVQHGSLTLGQVLVGIDDSRSYTHHLVSQLRPIDLAQQ